MLNQCSGKVLSLGPSVFSYHTEIMDDFSILLIYVPLKSNFTRSLMVVGVCGFRTGRMLLEKKTLSNPENFSGAHQQPMDESL